MVNNRILNDSKIREAWKLFTTKGMIKREVLRDKIMYSWARARLSRIDYQMIIIKLSRVIQVNDHYEFNPEFIQELTNKKVGCLLIDNQGVILHSLTDDILDIEFDRGLLFEENKLGTWSYHLSCQSENIEEVVGSEHYLEKFHQVIDFTIPIEIDSKKIFVLFYVNFCDYHEQIQNFCKTKIETWLLNLKIDKKNENNEKVLTSSFNERAELTIDLTGKIESIVGNEEFHSLVHENCHQIFKHFSMQPVLIGKSQMIEFEELVSNKKHRLICLPIMKSPHSITLVLLDIESLSSMFQLYQGFRPIYSLKDLIGDSKAIQEVIKRIEKHALTNHSVLITGDHGTGKKVAANCIHSLSNRSNKPFLWLDCSKIHHARAEIILFGSKDGRDIGLIEMASGGTIYLDRANELLDSVQMRLFKIISKDTHVEIYYRMTRIILGVTIHKEAEEMSLIAQLKDYLKLTTIEMPRFNKRQTDFNQLARMYLSEVGINEPVMGEQLSLLNMSNIHENAHAIRNILNRVKNEKVMATKSTHQIASVAPDLELNVEGELFNLDEIEMKTIIKALITTNYNMSSAAKLLGIGRTTLYRKIEKYNIALDEVR
jgi:transcriptional regulator of acetoin/glycerol metabolism